MINPHALSVLAYSSELEAELINELFKSLISSTTNLQKQYITMLSTLYFK